MATWIWVNMSSCNGLLSEGIKPLPETMLTAYQMGLIDTPQGHFTRMFKTSIPDIRLKFDNLILQLHLLGTHQLTRMAQKHSQKYHGNTSIVGQFQHKLQHHLYDDVLEILWNRWIKVLDINLNIFCFSRARCSKYSKLKSCCPKL